MIGRESFFNFCDKLTPNATSLVNVFLNDFDAIPLPKFPKEEIQSNSESSSETPEGPNGTISLSDPNLKITGLKSDYLSETGVRKDGFRKAVREAARISRNTPFEIFNRNHLNVCKGLIEVLYYIAADNLNEALSYAIPLVNEELLNYCICVVARHREDFKLDGKLLQLPSHCVTHPSSYFDVSKVDIKLLREPNKNIEIEVLHDFTATDADTEHFVAYFREDIGINLHHRHWHEVYPTNVNSAIVNPDRRGELFIYMHGQILARYNFERLCNGLEPVKKFVNFREPIKEAYYPKLDAASDLKIWSPRQPNAQLTDVDREGISCEVADLERWLERLIHTIDRGYPIRKTRINGEIKHSFENQLTINDLGNTIEASPELSYNYNFYGDIHNNGHTLFAYCHDPDNRFKEIAGVLSRTEAAMRDPIFYRWHAFIDDIIDRYRKTLTPYDDPKEEEREFNGIEIESVEINTHHSEKKNVIKTFWQKDSVDVSDGILSLKEHSELKKRPEKVFVKFSHLQHTNFTYKFKVRNSGSKPITGVFRIFMAPKFDETKQEMKFNKLRKFMIELDKFTYTLENGINEVSRESTSSSVTIPFEQTFMNMEEAYKFYIDEKKREKVLSYCGCGWPHHMLIGKGTESGYPCILFVMITNYDKDKVENSAMESESCAKSSISYCGVRDKKYPDKRPMGFPFDRPVKDSKALLASFMTKNMYQIDFKIEFTNETKERRTMTELKS